VIPEMLEFVGCVKKFWSNNQGIDNLCYSSMVPGDLLCISGILKKERANHVQETSL
jgi:hypothetical protein